MLSRLGGRALRLGCLWGRVPRLVRQLLSSEIYAHCKQPREREIARKKEREREREREREGERETLRIKGKVSWFSWLS